METIFSFIGFNWTTAIALLILWFIGSFAKEVLTGKLKLDWAGKFILGVYAMDWVGNNLLFKWIPQAIKDAKNPPLTKGLTEEQQAKLFEALENSPKFQKEYESKKSSKDLVKETLNRPLKDVVQEYGLTNIGL